MGEAVASLLMRPLTERALDVARAFVMASGDREQLTTIEEIVAVAMAAESPSCPGDQAVAVASHFFVAGTASVVCELSTLATTTAADSANLDASGAPCGTDACAVSIEARTALAAIGHVVHRVFSVTASLDVGVATAATVFVMKGLLLRSPEVHLALHGGGVESANAASHAATEALLTAGGVHPTPSGAAVFHPALAADVLGVLTEHILPRGHPGATPCIVVVPGVGPSRRAAGTCCHNCTPRLCVSSRMLPYISVPPFCLCISCVVSPLGRSLEMCQLYWPKPRQAPCIVRICSCPTRTPSMTHTGPRCFTQVAASRLWHSASTSISTRCSWCTSRSRSIRFGIVSLKVRKYRNCGRDQKRRSRSSCQAFCLVLP